MNELHYPALTHVQDRDGRPTNFDESRTDSSDRLDHSRQPIPDSAIDRAASR
jgi:hypothetical protein